MSARSLGGGRYLLAERPLGSGGMGTVWKAYDTVLRREVAVKELRIPEGLNPEEQDKLRMRALREASAAAGLEDPAIVTVYDVVDEGGRPWIVMKLLPGPTLEQAVRANGPLSPRRAAELGVRMIEALSAAHANGVLHRDVKPQNVMLGGDNRWMLTDFGIASVAGATRTLTGTGIVTGTLGYVAPERLSGAEPGTPADLWALGATLYFAVEGRNGYDHDDLPAMIAAVLTREPDPMRLAGPVGPVIAALMQRDPSKRLDAETAREQLLAIAGGDPTFENPTVVDPGRRTEKIGTGTRVLQPEKPPVAPGMPPGAAESLPGTSASVLGAQTKQLVVLNGAIAASLGLMAFELTDGMPYWIAGVMAAAIVVGVALGAVLGRLLGRWLGLPTAAAGSALLIGEAILAAGIVLDTRSPALAAVLCAIALVFFVVWHRLATALHRKVAPSAKSYRRAGWIAAVAGLPLGVVISKLGFLTGARLPWMNLIIGLIGAVVTVTALATLPTLRSAPLPRASRAGVVVTVIVLLLIPVLVGARTIVFYVQGLDDFTSTPDICTSSTFGQEQIAKFVPDAADLDVHTGSEYRDCTWARKDDDTLGLTVGMWRYDNQRDAEDRMAELRSDNSTSEVSAGDDAVRYSEDYSDEAQLMIEVRLDNLVLTVELDQPADQGLPETQPLTDLATDLTADLETHRPPR